LFLVFYKFSKKQKKDNYQEAALVLKKACCKVERVNAANQYDLRIHISRERSETL